MTTGVVYPDEPTFHALARPHRVIPVTRRLLADGETPIGVYRKLAGGPGIETPWPTDDPGLSRAERREVQALLTRRGYDVGAPDGAIGAKTKSAIADFEGKNGLKQDGRASVKVLEALRR